jgi:hypothetical protein
MRVTLDSRTGSDLRPRCASILTRLDAAKIFHCERGLPHPLGMFNRKWGRVEILLTEVLDRLEEVRKNQTRNGPQGDTPARLLEAQRVLLYEAAELIEDFESNYRLCLFSGDARKQPKVQLLKSLRDHVAIQCNRMKHNHATLGYIQANHSLGIIPGYVVLSHLEGGAMGPYSLLHDRRPAFSFAIEVRKILSVLYQLGDDVARFIEAQRGDLGPVVPATPSDKLIALLKRVADWDNTVFPSEHERDMPKFAFDGALLHIEPREGSIHRGLGQHRTWQILTGDGVTTRYQVAGI